MLAEEDLARPVRAGAALRAQLEALEGCVERVGAEVEAFDATAARSEIGELERTIAQGRTRAEELRS